MKLKTCRFALKAFAVILLVPLSLTTAYAACPDKASPYMLNVTNNTGDDLTIMWTGPEKSRASGRDVISKKQTHHKVACSGTDIIIQDPVSKSQWGETMPAQNTKLTCSRTSDSKLMCQ